MRVLLFALLLSSSSCLALNPNCPPQENIAPYCICKNLGNGPMMKCDDIMSPDELVPPVKETENHDMFSLAIHDSSLLYLPTRIFHKTYFKKIRLVGTHLMSLSESDFAFEGLEYYLEEFRVMEAHYVTQWSWSQLQKLQTLQLIDVDWVSLGSVGEPFPKLKSLTALGIMRADISFLVDNAFSQLKNLRILNLQQNEISELKRSMLPDPANELLILNLNGNKLSSLPPNFFQEMPSLSDVNLDNNKIVTLKENVFAPALHNLITLSLSGNDLRCDCRLRWLLDERKPHEFNAVCSYPQNLRGKHVKSLVAKVLWC